MKIQVIKPPYTVTQAYPWRDTTLSNSAKGLLITMLEKSDGFVLSIHGLVTLSSDGESGIRRQLKELETAGYIRRQNKRVHGKFSADYLVSDNKNVLKAYLDGSLKL